MRPLHIISTHSNDVRRERATVDEIEAFIEGRHYSGDRLARVSLDADGNIVATPLTDAEVGALRAEIHADRDARFRDLLDATFALYRNAKALGIQWSYPLTIWPVSEPWAESLVRSWAAENGLEVHDEPPPRTGKEWIRTANVKIAGGGWYTDGIVHMQWPSVKLGEVAIAVEAMCIGLASAFEQEAA